MFFSSQSIFQKKEYEDFLKIAWSLSNLFSESSTPYLYYRIAEKVFCRAFWAEDLSRWDVSVDAKTWNLWIWLKTFLVWNNNSLQKVAEFNKDKINYSSLKPEYMIRKVSELRNERINFTKRAHAIENTIYHCVIRDKWKFMIYEESMDLIVLENIKNIKTKDTSISFDDWLHEYSFSLSKSTLLKKFNTNQVDYTFDIQMLEDPLFELRKLIESLKFSTINEKIIWTIFLPLYGSKNFVYEKSWLNQWNAGWRKRDYNEVYLPVPAEIHKRFPDFFPNRNASFELKLPNWDMMTSKICQDWGKALMSYSNKELWKWILRDVLNLREWELLTYDKLKTIWIDSVRIDKINDWTFEINFSNSWSYDSFMLQGIEE